MRRKNERRWSAAALGIAALAALIAWAGCSEVDLLPPDDRPPTGTTIENPTDGAYLNSTEINVRGRAEVGATVEVFVDGEPGGSATAWPAVPDDGRQGRYTIDEVDLLGQTGEGDKLLAVKATDAYGNETPDMVSVSVTLDTTAPAVRFVDFVEDSTVVFWDEEEGRWQTAVPRVHLIGQMDTTAAGAKLRYAVVNEFQPDSFWVYTPPAGPDSIRFSVTVTTPLLLGLSPHQIYYVRAYDEAGNINEDPVRLFWKVTEQKEVLAYDDGGYPPVGDVTTGQRGMRLATGFQAPAWANYVIEIRYFIYNDNVNDPSNPMAPTTEMFTSYVFGATNPDEPQPGITANLGKVVNGGYQEDEWLEVKLTNAVDLTDVDVFPSKWFFAGMEWEVKNNPYIGLDKDDITNANRRSYRYNWTVWERFDYAKAMIRAVVTDIPPLEGATPRVAVLEPTVIEIAE